MPLDLLSEILEHVRAEQVIGEYISLRQAGKNFKGLCPFHAEKTPSFSVNPENGLWYCFGCGAGGNLVQFVMKIESLSFQEARNRLAEKAGITIDPESEARSRTQNRLREALERALSFYAQTLFKSHAGEEGLRYLEGRGLDQATLETFQLGMSPGSGHALLRYLENCEFSLEEMREAGLATRSDPPRDYFRRRVMFPIRNHSGHLIGFGGRTTGDEQPKYLNSPESAVFKKGENLYGLHLARGAVAAEKFALLAEGYMDVLMLHRHGFKQAVASLGTSLTSQQAKLLSRHTSRVVVGYDGDAAGMQAMQRAMGILEGANLEMGLIALPQGEDPDSYLNRNGADAFRRLLENPLSPVDFVFSLAAGKCDPGSPEGKKRIVDEVVPVLRGLRDPILRDEYVKKVAQDLGVSESVLRRRLRSGGETARGEAPAGGGLSREHEILRWLLAQPELAATVWSILTPDDFAEGETREGALALHRIWSEKKKSIAELDALPDPTLLFLSRLSTETPVGEIGGVQPLLESQKNRNLKKELAALKEDVSRRLKEGKLEPTDEAYRTYLELLRKTKLREEETGA